MDEPLDDEDVQLPARLRDFVLFRLLGFVFLFLVLRAEGPVLLVRRSRTLRLGNHRRSRGMRETTFRARSAIAFFEEVAELLLVVSSRRRTRREPAPRTRGP